MSSEEFTVISKYELYEHGVFIRALTEEEIEKDPVVAECLKSIEEEREKIMLERLAALCGAVPPPGAAADKKKKNAKKTKAEKARPKSG
jgi:ribosomal protein L12E/L44/L45/RPP1/RPP2